ncbi:hypothetical protein [Halobaculum halobium]|uniref:KTSC domain-containing protein n=1 Tax=Halobaculum halobium TaxID=3032281 RepID=A0ABD5T5H9_9EURY|nr:hypothetical protein [Halobaculum sp. SYNS20]
MSDSEEPVAGDSYDHPDGKSEVVYLVEDGRVLTFREYPSVEAFEATVDGAAYRGIDEAVAGLPGREAFAELDLDDAEGDS